MIMKPGYDDCKGLQGYKLYQVGHVVNLQHVVMIDFNYSHSVL